MNAGNHTWILFIAKVKIRMAGIFCGPCKNQSLLPVCTQKAIPGLLLRLVHYIRS